MRLTNTIHFLIAFVIATLCSCDLPHKPKQISRTVIDEPLGVMIDRIATEEGIHPTLATALIKQESGFNPNALSKTNAVGLAQVLRSTAKVECGIDSLAELAEKQNNLHCGFRYLRKLKDRYGTWKKALISFNAGPGNMVNPHRDPKKYRDGVVYAEGILTKFIDQLS